MAVYLKNLFNQEDIWLTKSTDEDSAGIDIYLPNENHQMQEQNNLPKPPKVIGILPIRNAVAYPGTVTPLAIGRQRSKALLEDTTPNESIIGLVTQRNPQTEKPSFNDLYSVGTAATILKVIKMPQGSAHIVVHAISRFRIVKPIANTPYLKARVEPLPVKVRMTKKLRALIVNVRQAANRVIALSPNVPEEASVLLENIENASALADFLAANLSLDIQQKQQLLEELDATKRLETISVALANQLEVSSPSSAEKTAKRKS